MSDTSTVSNDARIQRVLIPFHTVSLYGMERGVIETFDLLRPEVRPHFLMSYTTQRLSLPVLDEVRQRGLSHSFLSDLTGWPRIGKPRSAKHFFQLAMAMLRGNRDVMRESWKADVIYLPSAQYFYFAVVAAIVHRLLRKRIVYHFHDLYSERSFHLQFISFFVTDFVHCSQLGFELVRDANSYLVKKRNHILPYRTGSARRIVKDASANAKLEDFDGNLNLLFFGQVSPHKGVDILLEAFDKVAAEYPAAVLHLAGGYADSDFQSVCTEFMEQAHLKNRIVYWGYVEDIEQLLKLAYVHVHPSPPSRFMDTFPLAALESMRKGVPTVCFKSGGLPEMIVDGSTGVICENESAECFAAGLRKLLNDPDLRNRYSKQASERYQQLYSEQPVKRAWLELFPDETPDYRADS